MDDLQFRDLVEEHNRAFASPPPALSFGGSSSSRSTDISSSSTTTSPAMREWAKDDMAEEAPLTPSLPAAYLDPSSRTASGVALSSAYSSPPASPSLLSSSTSSTQQPPNFGVVATEVYRSSFPRAEHFPYLTTLRLKTVLVLVLEEYPEENRRFFEAEGIELIQLGMPNNKDPRAQIPADTIRKALAVVLDRRKHPLLIHCNRGKHRTGCVVGCLRRMQRWTAASALDEYTQYAHPKERVCDQNFIGAFGCDEAWQTLDSDCLPDWIAAQDCSKPADDDEVFDMADLRDTVPVKPTPLAIA